MSLWKNLSKSESFETHKQVIKYFKQEECSAGHFDFELENPTLKGLDAQFYLQEWNDTTTLSLKLLPQEQNTYATIGEIVKDSPDFEGTVEKMFEIRRSMDEGKYKMRIEKTKQYRRDRNYNITSLLIDGKEMIHK